MYVCRYWLADLCAREGIDFVLGHALYMKAIHGGRAKNDRMEGIAADRPPPRLAGISSRGSPVRWATRRAADGRSR
jgi:hypothetical protein